MEATYSTKAITVCYLITVLHCYEHGLKLSGGFNHCHYMRTEKIFLLYFFFIVSKFYISILSSSEKKCVVDDLLLK